MKRAEDFRDAFGPAESGFEAAVRDTLEELQAKETRRAAVRGRRFLVPVIAAVLIMILGIGIAATGRWGVLNWLAENRPEGAESTELPFAEETAEPFLAQADSDLVTITVREAKTDGYGIYLSVAFTPKEKDTLALNWSIDPYSTGPEDVGFTPDDRYQTLGKWADSHGYRLLRVAVMSMPEEPEGTVRYDENGEYIYDRTNSGPDFDSYVNNTMVVEEDGTSLVMAAGGCLDGREEYTLGWTAAPFMAHSCEPDLSAWRQGKIRVRIPKSENSGEAVVLAEYTGSISSLNDPEKTVPVTVRLIRTGLNDYYRVECEDPARSGQAPALYLADGQGKAEDRFAWSRIYLYSAQKRDGKLVFTSSCSLPEELPDRLCVVWYDGARRQETTVVEKTDR